MTTEQLPFDGGETPYIGDGMNEQMTVEIDTQELEHLRYWAMLGAAAVEDARDALSMWDLNAPGSDEHGMLLLSYRFSESYGWSVVTQQWSEIERYRWPNEIEVTE